MTTTPSQLEIESAPRIECAQVYGGTEATDIPVEMPGLTGVLYANPCQGDVGGDIHYLSVCGSGVLSRFCLADVVGHGIDVAAVSRETHDLLKSSVNWTDHRRVLRQLNKALVEKGLASFTTAAMFTYFPPTRHLTFSYAGHPPAWRWSAERQEWTSLTLRSEDRPRHESADDIPLAVSAETEFSRSRTRLETGDVLVVTTDGVTDALNDDAERFGDDRLHDTLRSITDLSPRAVVDTIVEDLTTFTGGGSFDHDDVTVLAVQATRMTTFDALRRMVSNRVFRPLRKPKRNGRSS